MIVFLNEQMEDSPLRGLTGVIQQQLHVLEHFRCLLPFIVKLMLVYILYFMHITKEREPTSDSLHDYEPHGWMNTATAAGEKFQSCKKAVVSVESWRCTDLSSCQRWQQVLAQPVFCENWSCFLTIQILHHHGFI